MENKKTITEQIADFKVGMYNSDDTQCDAGWYDWFCKDTSLKAKTQTLYKKLIKIEPSTKFDSNKTYMFMKNNCPMAGRLYDDFRICDLETGKVIFTITPSCGHTRDLGKAQVHGKENGFDKPLVEGTWKEVVAWFLGKEVKPAAQKINTDPGMDILLEEPSEKPVTEDLTTKARTVTLLEQLEAQAKLAYDGELYWSACLILQAMQNISLGSGLQEGDYDYNKAADLCIALEDMVMETTGLGKRFDCLTATSCPDCWK